MFTTTSQREIEVAFDLNGDDDSESTPLTVIVDHHHHHHPQSSTNPSLTATYDFNREYDFPPPGSPPLPSAQARPNDYGNSNGLPPTSPIDSPPHNTLPWYRRLVAALVPSNYQLLPTHPHPTGAGTDGVFANVVAKPQPARTLHTDNGQLIVMPEDSQKDTPPSYQEAQADAVPPYWETTIHAPGLLSDGGLYVDDLPTGSLFMFCATAFVSFFFQFIGFLVTYLLHTTHAAKYGSRAGLGLTLIQYAFSARIATSMAPPEASGGQGIHGTWEPVVPADPQNDLPTPPPSISLITSKDWLSIFFMSLGWFLLLTSVLGFYKVKRYEKTIQQSSNADHSNGSAPQRGRRVDLFGFPPGIAHREQNNSPPPSSDPQSQLPRHDENIARELRNAGLI